MITREEIDNFIKKYPKVKQVNCIIVDLLGLTRGKQMGINKLKSLTKPSVTLPKSILLQNSMGENFGHSAVPDIDPDYFAHGIAGSLQPALWTSKGFFRPSNKKSVRLAGGKNNAHQHEVDGLEDLEKAHVFLNLLDNHGRPFVYNGRELVRKMVNLIKKDFGYRVNLALELEFYLYAQNLPGFSNASFKQILREDTHTEDFHMLEPINHLYHYPYLAKTNADCYGIDSLESIAPFTDALVGCLISQGIESDGVSSEYGSGQFEVNLKHITNPVLACDQTVLMKYTLKNLAKQFGMNATFMAVPNLNSPNGMHINVSLQDQDGNNVFYKHTKLKSGQKFEEENHISKVMKNCIGGLEHTARDAMLLFAPNFNSYKRYYCQGYSPGDIGSWGINNRTVSLRVPHFNKYDPDFRKSMRVEHRLAGADSNPYLATAGVLAGMYIGLKKSLKPSKIEKGSTYRFSLWETEIPSMVSSLQNWKKQDNALRALFGKEFCDVFYEHRVTEWKYFLGSLSQLDFDWYAQY